MMKATLSCLNVNKVRFTLLLFLNRIGGETIKLQEKLVSLRKEKGLTQLTVAEELDVSRQAISKWESGAGLPSVENLRAISKLYGVPVDYLLDDESECPFQPGQAVHTVRSEKARGGKGGKWAVVLICIFITVIGLVVIGKIMSQMDGSDTGHIVTFDMMGSEDWSNREATEFSVHWP